MTTGDDVHTSSRTPPDVALREPLGTVDRDTFMRLLDLGQNAAPTEVVALCEGRITSLRAEGGDPDQELWLLLIVFYSALAHPSCADLHEVAESLVVTAGRTGSPLWQAIGLCCRALSTAGGGGDALSHPDLGVAAVLLEDHLPSPDRTRVFPPDRGDMRGSFLHSVAGNAMALALSRLGLRGQALRWLHRVEWMVAGGIPTSPRVHVIVFNSAWVQANEAFEADLEGDPARGRRHYLRAATLFQAAAALPPPQNTADRFSGSIDLAAAALVLAGDPAGRDLLLRCLSRALLPRADHQMLVLLAAARLANDGHDFEGALEHVAQALAPIPVDQRARALCARLMTEKVVALRHGTPPSEAECAQADLLAQLFRHRRRQQHSRTAAFHEAVSVARRRQDAEAARAEMMIDDLTGLGNRRMLDERFTSALAETRSEGRGLSVVFADVDRFKDINDRSSHLVGDRVLREFATAINGMLRPGDIAVRYGGDEFVLVLPDTDAAVVGAQMDRVREQFRTSMLEHPDVRLPVSFSAGVVEAMPGISADQLLLAADETMLESKRAGRNGVLVRPTTAF